MNPLSASATVLSVGGVFYALGCFAYLVLSVLLLTAWRGRLSGGMLLSASALNTIWCALVAAFAFGVAIPFAATFFVEALRDTAWLLFLVTLLGQRREDPAGASLLTRFGFPAIAAFGALVAATVLAGEWLPSLDMRPGAAPTWVVFLFVLMAVLGLALVEQLYRNTRPERRWAVKLLCLGVGGLFAYDFFLFSDALLFKRFDLGVWSARGLVNAMTVPLVALAAVRNPQWSVEVFVSRHVVFHTAALFASGIYLLLMAAAGYYIRVYGGTWGTVGQSAFLFGAVLVLLLLLFSGQTRARARVFLGKHFFKNRYDYREEWLRFTDAVSGGAQADQGTVGERLLGAVAQIMSSPGAALWQQGEDGSYRVSDALHLAVPEGGELAADASLVRFLRESGWVVYLDEYARQPERYGGMQLPGWLSEIPRAWLIVPLLHVGQLVGFVVLVRAPTKRDLNWEDSDLLKTVGRQGAGYLALVRATRQLADARQFEAFNRLSAYVVHDLKNLVAQLSLVVVNSRRFREAPGFIDDALATVESATGKMNRLLAQLRKGQMPSGATRAVDLRALVETVLAERASVAPAPSLRALGEVPRVQADVDRLSAVINHLVQNAQEATPEDGKVEVLLTCKGGRAVLEVRDTGCGMDRRFIAERLFRPFDTTKGNAGMGIGAYESREFIQAIGGTFDVNSALGEGTAIRFTLPLVDPGAAPALETAS